MFNNSIRTVSSAATIMIGTTFLALSAVAIATPARADVPAGFQKAVETSVDNTLRFPAGANHRSGVVTVAVSIDADGSVMATSIAKTSGVPSFDAEALHTAKSVSYPATGKRRTVAMVLGFGKRATARDAHAGKQLVDAARSDRRRLLATETTVQPNG